MHRHGGGHSQLARGGYRLPRGCPKVAHSAPLNTQEHGTAFPTIVVKSGFDHILSGGSADSIAAPKGRDIVNVMRFVRILAFDVLGASDEGDGASFVAALGVYIRFTELSRLDEPTGARQPRTPVGWGAS